MEEVIMKKFKLLGILVLSSLLFTACGDKKEEIGQTELKQTEVSSEVKIDKNSKEVATEKSEEFVEDAKDANFDGKTLKGNSYSITILEHKVIQPGEKGNEYSDNPVIAFWYDTTVNADYNEQPAITPSMAWIMNFKAIQDNDENMVNELKVSSLPDEAFLQSQTAEIKPGGTVKNAVAYELTDDTTPVTLVAQNMLGDEFGSHEFAIK